MRIDLHRGARRLAEVPVYALLLTLGAVPAARANYILWNGGGVTNSWNEGTNWQGSNVPSAGDTAAFGVLSSKACTIDMDVVIATMTIDSLYTGTINVVSTVTLSLSGHFEQDGGTVDLQGSSMRVAGDWIHTGGVFSAGTSTVIFHGAGAPQMVDARGQAFSTIMDSNTSPGGLTFSSVFTAADFLAQGLSAAATIYFNADSTFTITNLNLHGSAGQLIALRSTAAGVYTHWNVTGTDAVTYVDARDIDAAAGIPVDAGLNSVNSGHNVNWNFSASPAPVTPAVSAVGASSMTVTWGSVGSTGGYSLEASTGIWPNTFGGNVSSVTANGNATFLSFNPGTLLPNTSYYVRVGALWAGTTIYADAMPSPTHTLAIAIGSPANLRLDPSIHDTGRLLWTWDLVSGATQYNVYVATAPAVFVGSNTSNTFYQNALSPDTTYAYVITAIVGGQESVRSSSFTACTMAMNPDTLTFPSVSSSSETVAWLTHGARTGTPYVVTYTADVAWQTGITTVTAFSGNMNDASTPISGLNPSTLYYFRIYSQNRLGEAFYSLPGTGSQTTTAGVGVSTGTAGGGTASVWPTGMPEGDAVSSTLTYIVPAGGMTAGGRVAFQLPDNWYPYPQTFSSGSDGFVSFTAASQGNATLTVMPVSTRTYVVAKLNTGSLAAGATIQALFRNFHGCPPPNSVGSNIAAQWQVLSALNGTDPLTPLAASPSQTMQPGTVQQITYDTTALRRAAVNQASAPLGIVARDGCWQPAALTAPVHVTMSAWVGSYISLANPPDLTAQFALTPNFTPPLQQFTMPAGVSSTTVYFRSSQIGDLQIAETNSAFLSNTTNYCPAKIYSAFTFSGVGLDGGTPAYPPVVSMNLTPDGDGVNDRAFIRFTPSDPLMPWRVTISSDGFQSVVYDYSGSSNSLSQVSWDGHLRQNVQDVGVVPDGDYWVKVEAPGVAQAPLMDITVHTQSISGRVTMGPQGAGGVRLYAQAVNSPGWSNAVTDASGYYVMHGLIAGTYYNLYGTINSSGTVAPIQVQRNNVIAGTTNADLMAQQPGILRVHAVLPSSASIPLYGNLNIHPNGDWSRNYWGMLQFNVGDTDSGNGDYFHPSTWTLIGVDPGSYAIQLQINAYGVENVTATVGVGETVDVVIALHPRVNISGQIILPSTVTFGTWVSVDVLKPGGAWANIPGGGASIDVGKSSATYWVYNVSTGPYRLVARAPGYVPLGLDVTVANTDLPGQDFNGFTKGGKINGSLTVIGNTSAMPSPLNFWLNAWSPALQVNANTSVLLPTSTSMSSASFVLSGLADGTYQIYPPWMDGYNADPPGMRQVTVSGGTGTLDITLRQLSGQITGTITLPESPPPDFTKVKLILTGPRSLSQVATSSIYSFDHLDTGYYTLVAIYDVTGAQVRQMIPVVNKESKPMDIDLSQLPHQISGHVSLSGSLSMKDPNGNPITVSLLPDLRANATSQTVYTDANTMMGFMGQVQCGGGTPLPNVPTARVEAFPKDAGSYGSSSRSGLDNCFGPGQFKYVPFNDDGSYAISGLSPGVWEISVYPFFDGANVPTIAWSKQVVTITDQDIPGIDFTLAQGHSVSGTISLPSGMTGARILQARVVTARGDWIQSSQFYPGGSNGDSVDYRFDSLPDGDLSLVVQDVTDMAGAAGATGTTTSSSGGKCSTKSVAFTVNGSDVQGLNVSLARAGQIVGRVAITGKNPDKSDSLTLITSNNSDLLPPGYQIAAEANPYFDGGWQQVNYDGQTNRPRFDANGLFVIDGLGAGNYDVHFRPGSGNSTGGGLSLANLTKAQIHVEEGQIVDIGTVKLMPGLSLTGSVQDSAGHPLTNIQIDATPSTSRGKGGDNGIYILTDSQGKFTLAGLDPATRTYDIVAARRPRPGDTNSQSVPYGEVSKLAVDVTKSPAPSLDFVLSAAHGIMTGRVVTWDLGSLGFPDNPMQGYPAAAIYLHRQGYLSTEDNPLGETMEITALDGRFRIANLVAGTYDVTFMSLNYRPVRMTIQLADQTPYNFGTITLQKGPSLVATVKTPDGRPVTTNDVGFAVAATPDLSSLIFGQILEDANTKNILSIHFSGFELSPKVYSILLADNMNTLTMPIEGKRVTFSGNDDSGALALTYQPGQPSAFAHLTKRLDNMDVKFYFTGSLRNLSSDQDPTTWITVTSGHGTLSGHTVTDDRTRFNVTYTPAPDEQNATLHLTVTSSQINPSTNLPFVISQDVELHFGQKAHVQMNISPILGGNLDLSESDDPSRVQVPHNALIASDGSSLDAASSYSLEFAATDNATTLAAPSPSARMASMSQRGPLAYLSESWMALSAAQAAGAVNPLSSFYTILLPAGLSHTLSQTAYLTLSYDTNADPSQVNVYYYDGVKYLLESSQRTIDPVNHTITVGVSHFSTFVVLENNLPVIIVSGARGTGADLDVFNFPNPFNLQTKTVPLTHGGSEGSLSTDGTIIRYFVPASKVGAATIRIYNVVGEKVRTLNLIIPTADSYNYVTWDGKNDAGRKVASGVYIGVLDVGGAKKYWKMAVIK